jgi:hypothetical protein
VRKTDETRRVPQELANYFDLPVKYLAVFPVDATKAYGEADLKLHTTVASALYLGEW